MKFINPKLPITLFRIFSVCLFLIFVVGSLSLTLAQTTPTITLTILNTPNEAGDIVIVLGEDVEVGFFVDDPDSVLSSNDKIQLVRVDNGEKITDKKRGNSENGSVSLQAKKDEALTTLQVDYVHDGEVLATATEQVLVVADEGTLALSAQIAALTTIVNVLTSPGGAVNGSGSDNRIARWNGTDALEATTGLFEDDAGQVGVGTTIPSQRLDVVGNANVTAELKVGSGIRFPDNSVQTTAATGGGGGVSESDDLEWTGTHTWKTDGGDGTGRTLKTFNTTVPAQNFSTVIFSVPIPNDTMLFLLIHAIQKEIPPSAGGLPAGVGSAMAIANVGGIIDGDREENFFEEIGVFDTFEFEINGTNVDVIYTNSITLPVKLAGWVEYTTVPIP